MNADLGAFSMWDLFRTEVESQAKALTDSLLILERETPTKDRIAPAMRAAHSVKGAARIVDLDLGVRLAHAMEDCLVGALEGHITLSASVIDVLLAGVDLLAGVSTIEEADAANWMTAQSAAANRLIETLTAFREGRGPAAQPAPEPAVFSAASGMAGPASAKPFQSSETRTVRVSAHTMTRLMALAGESLVQSRWLEPFSESLIGFKQRHHRIAAALEELRDWVRPLSPDAAARAQTALRLVNDTDAWATERHAAVDNIARQSTGLADRLYREVVAGRMRPFGDAVEGFPRLVRDVARQLGKHVQLDIQGTDTGVDRDVLDKLDAPLGHVIRNAIDHGIESPEDRAAAGKPPTGTLRIDAGHRAGLLVVAVSDDGRGVDIDRLRQKVVEGGFATSDMADRFSDAELLEFLFLPGFSTASAVTDVSGRGVGMDVVKEVTQAFGGSVRLTNRPGQGLTVHFELPLTLSVVRALVADIAGDPFAFPLTRIDCVATVNRTDGERVGDDTYVMVDGRRVVVVDARAVFGFEGASAGTDAIRLIVLGDRTDRYGLVVDRFVGEHDLVVRPLDSRLGKVRDIAAASLLEDGSPVLIVDVDDLLRSIEHWRQGGSLRGAAPAAGETATVARRKRILVVDDSLTVREVERALLEQQGYEVDVAVDGMDGWNTVRANAYDLVVTDVDMPRMTGIELVTMIRADPRLTTLPVMIVSYKDREEDRRRGLEAGASHYLTKSSFHDASLVGAVADLIGDARA